MNTKYLNKFTRTTPVKTQAEKIAIAKQILAEAMAKKEAFNKPAAPIKPITNIRRAVASLANKIRSKLKDLSRAFKKAWAIIKGQTVKSKVAGVSFNQKALQRLTRYNPKDVNVTLARESGNEHDVNAVAVNVSVNDSVAVKIGYLPKDLAQYIAKIIDSGVKLIAQFIGVTGGGELTYGALIEIRA